MENAGPWKAVFSGYMNPLGVNQPYANWHGRGWIANVDCNSGPWTKKVPPPPPTPPPLPAPTPPPELNRRSGCHWHKAKPPPHTHTHTHNIVSPIGTGIYVFGIMLEIQVVTWTKWTAFIFQTGIFIPREHKSPKSTRCFQQVIHWF